MFGGNECPKIQARARPQPVPIDIHYPCPSEAKCYAYPARDSNTNQDARILEYKQKKDGDYVRATEKAKEQLSKDIFEKKFDLHTQKRRFQAEIKKRLDLRLEEYDAGIDKRREKLRDIYAKEERGFISKSVDQAQRGGEARLQNMKEKSTRLIAKREAEREEIVKQKRLQQYMLRSVDLRDAITKKKTIESKNSQLQQILDNETKREVERETEIMWHDVAMKEMQAKLEREEYDALDRYERDKANMEVWDMQLQANELLKCEQKMQAEEDSLEIKKLRDQLRKEEIEALHAKNSKREQTKRELREQLEVQNKYAEQRKKEEMALIDAFNILTQLELDREKAKVQDTATAAKKELAQYRDSLRELAEAREEEERQLEYLLNEHKIIIQKKKQDEVCKVEAAKRRLQKEVMKGRAEQLKDKEERDRQEKKLKDDEDLMMKLCGETNDRLAKEVGREQKLAREKYKSDLFKQIEYNKIKEAREEEEVKRQIEVSKLEEEKYMKVISDMCSGKIRLGIKHPFRTVLEQYDCHCDSTIDRPF